MNAPPTIILAASLALSATSGCTADPDADSMNVSESGSEAPDPAPDSEMPDAFAGCDRTALEPDAVTQDETGTPIQPRWVGPAADPQTGALALDPATPYFVSATYLPLLPSEAASTEFTSLQPALAEALATNPGVLALQLTFSPTCNAARTFTVWRDEDAMVEFVVSEAHLRAMAAFPRLSRGGSTVVAWAAAPGEAISTESGLQRLGLEASHD